MDHLIAIPLDTSPAQRQSLHALQQTFAEVCNAVAGRALAQRCWNRVALHHLVYHEMRERFPDLGSQMVCNAIYSVSRACRLLFQNPQSPFHAPAAGNRPLPQVRFAPSAPVYFDRHTLSLRKGVLSMYTLEGRMKFRVNLNETQEAMFAHEKLKEICLSETGGRYALRFRLGSPNADETPAAKGDAPELPEYLLITENDPVPLVPPPPQAQTGVSP
ncbi:MAG: hypothetical protein H3C26_10005 [Rhodocyclaceae bacterium]|nr:hypothetical protein [Rhodocyclaceae bacterium]